MSIHFLTSSLPSGLLKCLKHITFYLFHMTETVTLMNSNNKITNNNNNNTIIILILIHVHLYAFGSE